jgi:hypothetical protein
VVCQGVDSSVSVVYTQIRYTKSLDGGVSWSATADLTSSISYDQYCPNIAVSDTSIFVVWFSRYDGVTTKCYQIRYSISGDAGLTWGTVASIDETVNIDHEAVNIICDKNNVFHITWERDASGTGNPLGYDGPFSIRYVNYTSGSFGTITDFYEPSSTKGQSWSSISADNSTVPTIHVIWRGKQNNAATKESIRHVYLGSSLTSWSSIENITDTPAADQNVPSMLYAKYPSSNIPNVGFCLIWSNLTSNIVSFYKSDDFSIGSSSVAASNYILNGLTDSRFALSGQNASEATTLGTICKINMTVNISDTVNTINVSVSDLNNTGSTAYVNAANISLWVCANASDSYGKIGNFTNGGCNLTINAANWNPATMGSSPWNSTGYISDTVKSIYIQLRIWIPSTVVAGTYFNHNTCHIYITKLV